MNLERTLQYVLAPVLTCTVIVFIIATSNAQNIIIDGDLSDWCPNSLLSGPGQFNLAHIARDTNANGQYIWNDGTADDRAANAPGVPNTDILEVRITGDTSDLIVGVLFDDPGLNGLSGDTGTVIVLTIDNNREYGSGRASLLDSTSSFISPEAAWEFLAKAEYISGSSVVTVFDTTYTIAGSGNAAFSGSNHSVEFSVPWNAIQQGSGYSQSPLRMTLSVFRATADCAILDVQGPDTSDICDLITNYAIPGGLLNTLAETGDDTVHYFFDLYFDSVGHVIAPIVVSEVLYDPTGSEPAAEFVELRNVYGQSVDFAGFRLGDEETMGGGEGMYEFPFTPDSIRTDSFLVVARDGSVFEATYGFLPDFEMTDASTALDMTTYLEWGSGGLSMGNGGDELLLLDNCETVIDVVVWESASWPGTLSEPSLNATNGKSIDRSASGFIDTDFMSLDFGITEDDGNPGAEGEPVEIDLDGDGVPDLQDNCPGIPNPLQSDTDADGIGDVCDDGFLTQENIGIGTSEPLTKLHVKEGAVFIDNAPGHLVFRSANNSCWAVGVNNEGTLTVVEIDCPGAE